MYLAKLLLSILFVIGVHESSCILASGSSESDVIVYEYEYYEYDNGNSTVTNFTIFNFTIPFIFFNDSSVYNNTDSSTTTSMGNTTFMTIGDFFTTSMANSMNGSNDGLMGNTTMTPVNIFNISTMSPMNGTNQPGIDPMDGPSNMGGQMKRRKRDSGDGTTGCTTSSTSTTSDSTSTSTSTFMSTTSMGVANDAPGDSSSIELVMAPIYRYCCYCGMDPRITHVYTMAFTTYGECNSEGISPGYLAEANRTDVENSVCDQLERIYSYWDVGNDSEILVLEQNRGQYQNNANYNFLEDMGYCSPNYGYCQANTPIYVFDSTGIPTGRVDHFYTGNLAEAQSDNTTNPWYAGGESGILCYVWSQAGNITALNSYGTTTTTPTP